MYTRLVNRDEATRVNDAHRHIVARAKEEDRCSI
jgi:hypothetical protein